MKKFISLFNIIGFILIIGLCVTQWVETGKIRHRRDELDKLSVDLGKKLAGTESALKTANDTVEEFRKRIEVLEGDNARLAKELKDSELRVVRLTGEVARLEKQVAAWKTAVDERDKVIVEQNKAINEQIAARNEATEKFNDLVGKYNELAKRTAEAEKLVLSARAERDKAQAELKAVLAANE